MAQGRIDIFSQTEARSNLSRFAPKERAGQRLPTSRELAQLPAEGKFVSREAPVPPKRKETFRVRTWREEQFNSRVTFETKQGFEDLRQQLREPMGAVLERALAALRRELAGRADHDEPDVSGPDPYRSAMARE